MRVVAEQEGVARDQSLAFTKDDFLQHRSFRAILQASARDLMTAYDSFPRVARLVASHQKWTLSQAIYALHLEREPGNPDTGITTARLLKFVHETGGASRNTAAAFIAELLTYKLLRDAEGGRARKKVRPLEPTEISEGAMLRWFMSQMGTLDRFDGKGRVQRVEADPSLFQRAQPIAARLLLSDRRWSEPPDGVATFVWTECGGLLLDDLMSRPNGLDPVEGKVWVEANLSDLAAHYMLSNTHIRRIFTRAQDAGLLGRPAEGPRGIFWLSERLIDEYCYWQAVKLAGLANGFEQAQRQATGEA
ncbi:hypothetical protein BC374_18655 [Ensifer sp. LC13]|uniref:hypothetical protein n=1 Tax=unclassified Ensifer TaxID=2633371 RepID=UPI000813D4D4|nr:MULTISPECIES: hypothetical protein [unclassified Ensifer]OCP10263.1 hypothetical protein BC374_18655 [Ensifer sp. LC13]OCP11259.1 hypothetical protein BBX50_18865 [Ensifer sp. LC11]OCP14667.1 hypothetical protein BC362_00225 [Ensifer sp. LC14]OCP33221.1 hypothetical protein BC364_17755 [Ensifer sp. LC499]